MIAFICSLKILEFADLPDIDAVFAAGARMLFSSANGELRNSVLSK